MPSATSVQIHGSSGQPAGVAPGGSTLSSGKGGGSGFSGSDLLSGLRNLTYGGGTSYGAGRFLSPGQTFSSPQISRPLLGRPTPQASGLAPTLAAYRAAQVAKAQAEEERLRRASAMGPSGPYSAGYAPSDLDKFLWSGGGG